MAWWRKEGEGYLAACVQCCCMCRAQAAACQGYGVTGLWTAGRQAGWAAGGIHTAQQVGELAWLQVVLILAKESITARCAVQHTCSVTTCLLLLLC